MKRLLANIALAMIGLAILGGVIGTATLIYFSFDLPKIATLADYRPAIPSTILSKDGHVLAEIGVEKREIANMDEIPKLILEAFLAAEDDKFFEHTGVDYFGVMRAMLANIRAGRVVQGGSTITQQVAKSLLLSRERSISRKVKDFLLAQKIEERFSKEEILFLYLNQVYLGGGYHGIKAAFQGYYDKKLSEASVAEAAMVAGLLVAPSKYSPYITPERAKARQEYVLKRLYETGKIDEAAYRLALQEKIKFRLRKKSGFQAAYFTDWIRQRMVELVGEESLLSNGFVIQTTLDWELQQKAEKEVNRGVREIDKRQGYKGPVGHIEELDRSAREEKLRKDLYLEASQYFTISETYSKIHEIEFDQLEMDAITKHKEDFAKNFSGPQEMAGYYPEDRLVKILETDKPLEAIVLKTDDIARVIYISVGGVAGIIPYEGFRWAHERIIQEEYLFFPFVTKPSSILKSGDIIEVSIKNKNVGLWGHVEKAFVDSTSKWPANKISELKKQRYLHCELEQEPEVQGALVSMNPFNGEVIAFVGGSDFSRSQFNRAIQSKRQPGSSFKPLLYAAAIENGFTPATIIIDSPEALGGVDETLNWKPRNYDGKFKGPITFRNALEQSRNVPTIKIAEKLGVQKVLDFTKRIGFNAKLDENLSLALGSFGVTLLDISSTYSIFPNGGKLIDPKTIVSISDRDGVAYNIDERVRTKDDIAQEEAVVAAELTPEGDVSASGPPGQEQKELEESKTERVNQFLEKLTKSQVYDPRLAYVMTNILRGVVLHGTGQSAKEVSTFLGGKTGTTNNYVDAWFLGFSSNLVTGVWTGFDDNKTLGWGETGTKSALPIWKEYMRLALKKYGENDFRAPNGVINVLVNKETGRLASAGSKEAFMESFVEGTEPGNERVFEELPTDNLDTTTPITEDDDYYNNQ
jgi:penicillin-binding protein 1A